MSDNAQNEPAAGGMMMVLARIRLEAPAPISPAMRSLVKANISVIEAAVAGLTALANASEVIADAYDREAEQADYAAAAELTELAEAIAEQGVGEDGRTLLEALAAMQPLPDGTFPDMSGGGETAAGEATVAEATAA